MPKFITLTTDFGLSDAFVGILHGVILTIAPNAQVIDLTHGIAPQDVRQGALVLAESVFYFPPDAIHVCVVDPGVGSTRRALAAEVGATRLVAPDNGVISLALAALERHSGHNARVYELNRPQYWLPRVSATFHGRDIFAPVAAHLANGVPPDELGVRTGSWVTLALPPPQRGADGSLRGHVSYIDRFGNLLTDIEQEQLAGLDLARLRISIGEHQLRGLKHAYTDAAEGELLALVSSNWRLEIARRNGSAAAALGAKVGDEVAVTPD